MYRKSFEASEGFIDTARYVVDKLLDHDERKYVIAAGTALALAGTVTLVLRTAKTIKEAATAFNNDGKSKSSFLPDSTMHIGPEDI